MTVNPNVIVMNATSLIFGLVSGKYNGIIPMVPRVKERILLTQY
ncbi:MAG: hypothetical protein P8X73_06710 [Ignavibacteriaceae bacterium]